MPEHTINTAAIIGLGTMGRQVAWAAAKGGIAVRLFDADKNTLIGADKQLRAWYAADLSKSDADAAIARLHVSSSLEDALTGVDLAFENVPESLDLKRKVHADIDNIAAPEVLQGTNASALKGSSIASATNRPDRFFNMNFTLPRGSNERLVEVMPNPKTSQQTLEAAKAWARRIGMIPIEVRKEILGYVQNRIWRAIKKECLFLVDQGYATPEDIDRGFVLAMGVEQGPFAIMDRVGLNTVKKVEEQYFEESADPSDQPPEYLLKLIAQGRDGVRTNGGFYDYPNPAFERGNWLEGGDNLTETGTQ